MTSKARSRTHIAGFKEAMLRNELHQVETSVQLKSESQLSEGRMGASDCCILWRPTLDFILLCIELDTATS